MTKVTFQRNRHSFLVGLGWPGLAMGRRSFYVYLGPWLLTVTWGQR